MKHAFKVLWMTSALITARCAAQPNLPPQRPVPLVTPEEVADELGEMPRINLQFTSAPIEDVLAELSKQSGIKVMRTIAPIGQNRPNQRATVNIKNAPFWEAMSTVTRQSGINLQREFGDREEYSTYLKSTAGREIPTSRNALGSIQIAGIEDLKTIAFHSIYGTYKSRLTVAILTEFDPRVKVVASGRVKIESAEDDQGRSRLIVPDARMKNFPDNREDEVQENFGFLGTISFPLKQEKGIGGKLVHLKGKHRLRIATRFENWELNDLKSGPKTKTMKIGGETVTLRFNSLQRPGQKWQIDISLQSALGDVAPRRAGSSLYENVRVLDAQNRPLFLAGSEGGGEGFMSRHIDFFPGANDEVGEPVKFIWTIPVEWKDVDIPFEFRDVPLP